ncbi:Leucine-rich repeat, ribonuclease inhibitor subtype [Plasmopara halstedii]|uniref:Leucine-rich repeat, ribonuclease inhibitor subtype n=1 Tax=Plasmopara halstedii TaxID=4781 RepID=A0A0N7L3I6_PLAHL|nr:Leucine-rich repeat, ribonuclease inhibitor subtype [Plasmopara halstedii]CEG35979.1 Leucine-rich repeat, ribonuclease inhibitor subtype [Plasmopara halstedii]|eukprot:XP_024572348.1 Leucine-rich repeat, ribonuclease inhibitor subtype [Plasmopara halstedii]
MADAIVFVPPQDIRPNNAVFVTRSLPRPLTWQRREHGMHRHMILTRIGQLLARNAQLVLRQQSDVAVNKTWALARKLEVLIFIQSASLLEYVNMDSLARRVQALTAGIVNKKIRRKPSQAREMAQTGANRIGNEVIVCCKPTVAVPDSNSQVMTALLSMHMDQPPATAEDYVRQLPRISHLAHERSMIHNEFVDSISRKRMCLASFCQKEPEKDVEFSELGILLFGGFEELSKLVWSYLDGVQIMRARSVCRSACMLAPLFVTSLQLSCNAIQKALATRSGGDACILQECIHLRYLEIVSLAAGMTFGKLSMRATNCPQRFVVTHDDHEQIVLSMAEQMRLNTFPGIVRLSIACLFTNEEADGEADVLLNALMLGCCPNIEELCLPGNSFGDYGASKVAQMLRARSCPNLTRLDLRRNFIGEDGVRILCHALADGCAPTLTELCLGGNTITDSSFHHVLYAMESRQLRNLRFLGIEMNYLTERSMEMLGHTVGKLVCPKLSQISYSDNSVENNCAKNLIAIAVHRERVWQAKRQQQIYEGDINSEDESTWDEQFSDEEFA